MLDATREVQGFAKGMTREDLHRDAMLFRALVRCIEVMGRHSRVGEETKVNAPAIRGEKMRNRLFHTYFDISKNVLWSTVAHDLSLLEPRLTSLLAAYHGRA